MSRPSGAITTSPTRSWRSSLEGVPSPSGEGQGWGAPLKQDSHLLNRAQDLRRNFTPFEAKLWRHLSQSQLGGYKFRRQHVIANCIVDFFCPQKGLIVEVDGDTHDPKQDTLRDALNVGRGYATIRFSNADIGNNIAGVLQFLLAELEAFKNILFLYS